MKKMQKSEMQEITTIIITKTLKIFVTRESSRLIWCYALMKVYDIFSYKISKNFNDYKI